MKRSGGSVAGLVLTVAIATLAAGCGWHKNLTFQSPTGRYAIEIWQTGLASEYGTRVVLVSGESRTSVFEDRREPIIYFFHVYWSQDEGKVAVVATGFSIWQIAADTTIGKKIPFEPLRAAVGQSLRQMYNIPSSVGDPVGEVGLSDYQFLVRCLHPEFQPTYSTLDIKTLNCPAKRDPRLVVYRAASRKLCKSASSTAGSPGATWFSRPSFIHCSSRPTR